MRTFMPGRELAPIDRRRARVAAMIARLPSTVTVKRPLGDGVTGPRVWTTVATFTGRLERIKGRIKPQMDSSEAYVEVPIRHTLTALRGTDYAGNVVDIQRMDQVTISGVEYVVEELMIYDDRLEATIALRG